MLGYCLARSQQGSPIFTGGLEDRTVVGKSTPSSNTALINVGASESYRGRSGILFIQNPLGLSLGISAASLLVEMCIAWWCTRPNYCELTAEKPQRNVAVFHLCFAVRGTLLFTRILSLARRARA